MPRPPPSVIFLRLSSSVRCFCHAASAKLGAPILRAASLGVPDAPWHWPQLPARRSGHARLPVDAPAASGESASSWAAGCAPTFVRLTFLRSLLRDRLLCGLDRLLVAQVVVLLRLQSVVELVHER